MSTTEAVVHACVRCGADAPYDFVDFWLCLDCYHVAGSTCAGIGVPRGSRGEAQATAEAAASDPGAVC